jgi:hypothetical protein
MSCRHIWSTVRGRDDAKSDWVVHEANSAHFNCPGIGLEVFIKTTTKISNDRYATAELTCSAISTT